MEWLYKANEICTNIEDEDRLTWHNVSWSDAWFTGHLPSVSGLVTSFGIGSMLDSI